MYIGTTGHTTCEQGSDDLLLIDELLLGEVEDLVALPRGGLPDHLAQRQLDILHIRYC